uniref:Uncharacterized protein n=2 Tax=Lotharella globosa TaxID=91324 RepID=A0A7S3ZIR3_9EUKA|mmetsp:Transcript_27183/g.52958  ORF Transcript_27183/g.52958 Transcript_27183/m.52958 type:complete len:278 (+) Transcript_27183:122-955(+)
MQIGHLIVAFGPAIACLLLISHQPQAIILALSSSFFFLMGQVCASIVWISLVPLRSITPFQLVVRVIVLELTRYVYYRLYEAAELSFTVMTPSVSIYPLQDISSSIVSGMGFGLMHTVTLYGILLSYSTGDATLFSPRCEQMSAFTLAAWLSLAFNALHVLLMILAFDGYRRGSRLRIGLAGVLHLTAELLTLLNMAKGGCAVMIPVEFALVGVVGLLTRIVTRQPGYRSSLRDRDGLLKLFGAGRRRSDATDSKIIDSAPPPLRPNSSVQMDDKYR